MKSRVITTVMVAMAVLVVVGISYAGGIFNKDYINPKLSCVGVQLLDSGKLELQSPSKEARAAFYAIHGGNIQQIVNTVEVLGAEYDGQCTHRNNSGSGNWLPVCRLR